MEGFFSKDQAARALGISIRHLDNYLREGKLPKTKINRRVWIPKAAVQKCIEEHHLSSIQGLRDIVSMQRRMDKLEHQIKILQRGLNFGASSAPMDKVQARMFHQESIDLLAEPGWPLSTIMNFSEKVARIREEALNTLLEIFGRSAIIPSVDLCRRMTDYVESHDLFPDAGTEGVRDRIVHSRRMLLGLMNVSLRIGEPRFSRAANDLYKALGENPGVITTFIGAHISDNTG